MMSRANTAEKLISSAPKKVIITTLQDLLTALQEVLGPGEEEVAVPMAQYLLKAYKARLFVGQCEEGLPHLRIVLK